MNIFIGNGANGTAENPDGGNAGLLAGNGGHGLQPHGRERTDLGYPVVTAAMPGCSSATAATAATALSVTPLSAWTAVTAVTAALPASSATAAMAVAAVAAVAASTA